MNTPLRHRTYDDTDRVTTAEHASGVSPPPRRIDSRTLFDAAREIEIDHRGQVYRLRRTSTGKLILTK